MIQRESLGLEEANKAVQAIINYVKGKKGLPVSIAVVDDRGELIMFVRMDGASANSANRAINKAYTSARLRMDTADAQKMREMWGFDFYDFRDDRFTPIIGGVCIRKKGAVPTGLPMAFATDISDVIGAIGVGGWPGNAKELGVGDDGEPAEVGRQAIS